MISGQELPTKRDDSLKQLDEEIKALVTLNNAPGKETEIKKHENTVLALVEHAAPETLWSMDRFRFMNSFCRVNSIKLVERALKLIDEKGLYITGYLDCYPRNGDPDRGLDTVSLIDTAIRNKNLALACLLLRRAETLPHASRFRDKYQLIDYDRFFKESDKDDPNLLIAATLLCEQLEEDKKLEAIGARAAFSPEFYELIYRHRDQLLRYHALPTHPARFNSEIEHAWRTSIAAKSIFMNISSPDYRPAVLSPDDNVFFGNYLAMKMDEDTLTTCFVDYNANWIRAFNHWEHAALQGNVDAMRGLYARYLTLNNMNERIDDAALEKVFAPPEAPKQDLHDSKHAPAPLSEKSKCGLPEKCKAFVGTLEKRAQYLKSVGWDDINRQMKQCVDYLQQRKSETRRIGWFGYSQADYKVRDDIMRDLATSKRKFEKESKPEEPADLMKWIEQASRYIDTVLPNVSGGYSKRFATLLQGLQKKLETILEREEPNYTFAFKPVFAL
jgi:hypothetical protein